MGHLCYLRKAAFAALCRICRMCGIQVDHLYPDGDAATEGETVPPRSETRRQRCVRSPVRRNAARGAPTRPGQSLHIPSQRLV
ncbi:hypothetical protein GTY87_26160 [Streptomyces sp. SID7813]|nr:hypothetical protein [Streptomyces sp. SID7813]NSL78063.1 hypothetical protein [Streptomyces coelicolor]QFI45009.1 hypothetical protein FQ762_26395 [Streptomyces coelicolor A3(2)]QKN68603.1 hypothetical protein HCU77_25880 [Streptomyces coelicolor]